MNRPYLLLSLFFCGILGSAKALDASIAHTLFAQDGRPYVELSMHISGQSLRPMVAPDSSLQVAVNILIMFKQGEVIVQYDKFQLQGPQVDIIDLKRYVLKEGVYSMEIEMRDANLASNAGTYKKSIEVKLGQGPVKQSGIMLLADVRGTQDKNHPLLRNGMVMEPLPYAFYGRSADKLLFYTELYSDQQDLLLDCRYRIEKMQNGETISLLDGEKKRRTASVTPLLVPVDISEIPSGNYQLVVEVYKEGELLTSKNIEWQRSNPIQDDMVMEAMMDDPDRKLFTDTLSEEDLVYALRAITVHVEQHQQDALDGLIKKGNKDAKSRFLYSFWAKESPINPYEEYQKYMLVVRQIDERFQSGFRNGFETDRGYVYLKYGPPNDIIQEMNEPSAPPYEVWSYNVVPQTGQNNVRFIFYNPSLAADDFLLLHSDVIGERQNPQWQSELYRDAPAGDLDGNQVQDNIGRRARRLIRDY